MKDFTLIIPTHNRHNYLKRSMEFFRNLEAEVVYCDSSSIKYEGELHPNINYLYLPDQNFSTKVLKALSGLETKFVALCADDDFIVLDSLYEGYSVLNKNSNYKTVVGKYISFKDNFDGHYYPLYQKIPDEINKTAEINAELFFSNYYQILWAMYDKGVLVKAFQIINEAKFHNDNYIELVIGSYACYSGGIKFLEEIWGVRELSTQEHWGSKHAPISTLKIAKVQGDFDKFRDLLNKSTFDGYAEKVLKTYLQYHIKANGFFKFWISKFISNNLKIIILKTFFKNRKASPLNLSQSQGDKLSEISEILFNCNYSNQYFVK